MTHSPRTIADSLRDASMRLQAAGFESSRLDAEVLLRHLLGLDRAKFLANLRDPLPEGADDRLGSLLTRRCAGESVAYITGSKEFMGLSFSVGAGVLVPRPETELLVEWAQARLPDLRDGVVVDVGTGSGAIILALAARAGSSRNASFVGCDRSPEALEFARRNRAQLGLDSTVHLVRGDLLAWLGRPARLVLANLPYLRPDQVDGNRDLIAEPRIALVSGADGLEAIRRVITQLTYSLAPGGAAILEIDPSQATAASALLSSRFPRSLVATIPDLAGLDRFVTVET